MPNSLVLGAIIRFRYAVFVLLGVLIMIAGSIAVTRDTDWQFFTWGSDLLFGQHHEFRRTSYTIPTPLPGGLELYANYPVLQIGPPSLVVAKALEVGPRQGLYVAGAAIQLLGLGFIYATDVAFRRPDRKTGFVVLVGGAMLTLVWGSLTQFRHLDDAMTLAASAAATLALTRGRHVGAGLLLGLAVASKPWGLPLLALALAPASWRNRTTVAGAAFIAAAAWWMPFVIADLDTLRLGQVALQLSPSSALSLVDAGHLPTAQTLRLLQLGAGTAIAVMVVVRGAWVFAPLAAFSFRLMLEPSAYPYYATAVVAAAFIADVGGLRARVPVLTSVATTGWIIAEVTSGSTAGVTRLLVYGGLTLAVTAIALLRPPRLVTAGMHRG